MMENQSPQQKYKSAVCGLYGNEEGRSGGLVCTSNLGFTRADKQKHMHSGHMLSGHSSLWTQAAPDSIDKNGRELNV